MDQANIVSSLNDLAYEIERVTSESATPKQLHSVSFLSFLQAALTMHGLWNKYLNRLDQIEQQLISSPATRSYVEAKLSKKVLNILNKLNDLRKSPHFRMVNFASSKAYLHNELAKRISNLDDIALIDGFSLIEHIALQAFFLKKGWKAQLVDVIGYNPVGATKFVSSQSRGLLLQGWLNELRDRLMVPPSSGRFRRPIFNFGELLHGQEDLMGMLPKIQAKFEELSNILTRIQGHRMLITSDHGYGIWIDQDIFFLQHGVPVESSRLGKRVLGLDEFIFFQVVVIKP